MMVEEESLYDNLGVEFDQKAIDKLSHSWLKNAGIKDFQKLLQFDHSDFNPEIPDYSLKFVPIKEHPEFDKLLFEQKNLITTCAWLTANKRIIAIEDQIVKAGLDIIIHPHMPGSDTIAIIARQTQLDEDYHSLFHLDAMKKTRKNRNYHDVWDIPDPVTVIRMEQLKQKYNESWQQQIIHVVFAVVPEVSFNPFFAELATEDIQPYNKKIFDVHAKDEARHGQTLAECGKALYKGMNTKQKDFFNFIIPSAINAFLEEDWSGWEALLTHLKIKNTKDIIEDIRSKEPENPDLIMAEFRPIQKLLQDMDIVDKVNFDFNRAPRL
jgi:hypothetical protein